MIVAAMSTSTESREPYTRRDCSGVLTARLSALLDAGVVVREEATLIESAASLGSFRALHQGWVLGGLAVLRDGFEPEAAAEFLHVNTRIPFGGEHVAAARAAVIVVGDALEMLRGLRSTLDYDPGA